MLQFYDYEVFKYDWLVVIIDPDTKITTAIVNDSDKLNAYFEKHQNDIWVGYNNSRYDQYIHKGILLGMNPKEISQWIIEDEKPGYQFSRMFNKISMINFDVALRNDGGLKSLEGFMGENIKETSVDFNIDRKLTPEEIQETIKYCTWDVESAMKVFLNRIGEFNAAMGIIKIFNLPLSYLSKTGAQRVAKILGGKGQHFDDEFEFEIAPTLKLKKYKAIENWYRNPANHDYSKKLNIDVAGVPHTFAWGGAHGARKRYYGEGIYIMADVTAYYPSLQLRYHWGYRNMANPENFEKIHGENLRFKELGDKKARLPYKIADNAISGQLKDRNSSLYDPRDNNAICVNGQLFLVDLIEKLEPHIESFTQSNTDGVLFKIKSLDDFEKIDDIVYEWEQRTGMRMGFDIYTKVYQKDVNNYLLVSADGKTKTKGSYTKDLSPIDNDLPIINKAMVAYMKDKIPVETTINSCDELIMFQKLVKLTRKYWRAWHNGEYMTEKCYRVFASTDPCDTSMGKCKSPGATIEKFGNTPEHCFFDNGNVIEKKVPKSLDKQWYISLAKDRLRQYGIEI